jgi:hypothetical protein
MTAVIELDAKFKLHQIIDEMNENQAIQLIEKLEDQLDDSPYPNGKMFELNSRWNEYLQDGIVVPMHEVFDKLKAIQ